MKRTCLAVLTLALLAVLSSGCAGARNNISYDPAWGDVARIERPVAGAIVSVVDLREKTRVYPKQVIVQTSYGGDVTYDINDRTPAEVIEAALKGELERLGVKVVKVEGMEGALDKETAEQVRKQVAEKYPDVKVAFGVKIKDFLASSRRTLVANKVHVSAWMQVFVLDMGTGDVIWSDYKTEWDDTVASADHNYMIEQLDEAVKNLMQKSVRENLSLRDLLVKISSR